MMKTSFVGLALLYGYGVSAAGPAAAADGEAEEDCAAALQLKAASGLAKEEVHEGLQENENWGASPGQYGYDDKVNALSEFPNPVSVPGHDKCGVNCVRLCQEGLGRSGRDLLLNKNSDCVNSCYAHSIETPHAAERLGDSNRQQGKYVQKVMAEYCDRGLCGAQLLQQGAEEGAAYSPGATNWVPDPRAMPSGWPKTCEKESYYCQELCQNLYHKPASGLGEHYGSTEAGWQHDQDACKRDCSKNFKGLTKYWDEWCTCFKGPGGNMHLEKVPGLLQQDQQEQPEHGELAEPEEAEEPAPAALPQGEEPEDEGELPVDAALPEDDELPEGSGELADDEVEGDEEEGQGGEEGEGDEDEPPELLAFAQSCKTSSVFRSSNAKTCGNSCYAKGWRQRCFDGKYCMCGSYCAKKDKAHIGNFKCFTQCPTSKVFRSKSRGSCEKYCTSKHWSKWCYDGRRCMCGSKTCANGHIGKYKCPNWRS